MRLILISLLSLITVAAFSQKKNSNKPAPLSASEQELNNALKLGLNDQYENAALAFQSLIKKEPANGNAYYYYGKTIIKEYLSDTLSNSLKEMGTEAEKLFQKGIEMEPTNEINDVGLGAVQLLLVNDTVAADKFFVKAEASFPLKQKFLSPRDARILTELGTSQLLGKVNRYKKAVGYLNRAKEINPNEASTYMGLGDVYSRQNNMKDALSNYNKALSLDPTSPVAKIRIGAIYVHAANLNAARPYLEEARDIDSTYAPAYRELGELYTMGGQFNLAKTNFKKFITLSGNNIPAKIQYAKALFRTKDYANALITIEEVLAVDKSRNYLNRLAGYCCFDKKPPELEKGKAYIETFFKNATPESIIPRDYLYYSRILFRIAKNDSLTLVKAFDTYKKAYAMDSNNVNLISEIASYYYYSRWYKDAIVWLNIKAKKGKPDTEDLMLIGKSYYQLAEFTKADSIFSQIIVTQPDNMQAYLWVARTSSSMDPSSEQGLARPKFDTMIEKIGAETTKYSKELQEAYSYLIPYYLQKKDYTNSKMYAKKLFDLDESNKKWQIQSLTLQAMIAHGEKKYSEARDFFIEIKKLDPGYQNVDKTINDYNKAIKAAAAAAAAQKK